MKPATCFPDHCFCEHIQTAGIAQPVATWSGLAFVAGAIFIVLYARQKKLNILYALGYAVLMILAGMGTMYYHARLNFLGQFFDLMGMYLLVTYLFFNTLARLADRSMRFWFLEYLGLNAVLAWWLIQFPGARRYIFAALVLLIVGTEWAWARRGVIQRKMSYLYWALGSLAVGFAIWILDITKVWCNPASWLQGHAVWHILSALAAVLAYMYYVSQKSELNKANN